MMRVLIIFGKLPTIINSSVCAELVKAFIQIISIQLVQIFLVSVAQQRNQTIHPGSIQHLAKSLS